MDNYEIKLKIADIIIHMRSKFRLEPLAEEEKVFAERYNNFFYDGKERSDINIKVEIVDKLPRIHKAEPIFVTYHFQNGRENWRLIKKDDTYIYRSPSRYKRQQMLVNKNFDRATAYLLPKNRSLVSLRDKLKYIPKKEQLIWNISDIIYDFLQVLLINYFAQRNQGIFTHSVGVKDSDGRGILFTGKSGCGKTTMAKLWYRNSRAMVLNDDRIIIRKINDKFYIYGSPWHGDFHDYLASRIESAPLEGLFFIHHAPENTVRKTSRKEAFNFLYPALFPTFWDRNGLENIVSFCQDLITSVPCYTLGFVDCEKVIKFVRKI